MKNLLCISLTIILTTLCFVAYGQNTLYGIDAGLNATPDIALTGVGHSAGKSTSGTHCSFFGHGAGKVNTIGKYNTGIGAVSLYELLTGERNTAVGAYSGRNITTGSYNTIMGYGAFGAENAQGVPVQLDSANYNVGIGYYACRRASGRPNSSVFIGREVGFHYRGGDYNVLIGYNAGRNLGGSNNVGVGNRAGYNNIGDRNIFIGDFGSNGTSTYYNDHLFITNRSNEEFIVGDIAAGKLGINTDTPQNALDVCGKIRGDEVIIENNWCDYVFYENYKLNTLEEEAQHIEEKGHLKGFESEEEMNGEIHVADVTKRQQVKIEEMMLHLIRMEKENNEVKERLKQLETENTEFKKEIQILKKS